MMNQKKKYSTAPDPVRNTPNHHHRSAGIGSRRLLSTLWFMGSVISSVERLNLVVAFAPAEDETVVGFRVCVGSISGGE